MTITQKMLSNLSCAFLPKTDHPIEPDNYDGLLHSFPSLELASSGFEALPESYKEALKEQAFHALHRVMTPSKADIALAAKGERQALTDDCLDALATSNRPDAIPSDLRIIRVTSWEPEKRVFIPLPAPKDASLGQLVKANSKPDGFMVNVPMRPIGDDLGTIDATAWRKGEASNIRVHEPKPLPAYQHPRRELTQGEQMAAAWVAILGRTVTTAKKTDRLAKLMAAFWDKGDGHSGLQPVMLENAAHRALGRIAKAERFNASERSSSDRVMS